jgi:type IV secretory pathway VirD2 relaxase
VVKARVVCHSGRRFRSAALAAHVRYLRREGVTRNGEKANLLDAHGDSTDERTFVERCRDDRHHFRFIVSPEDATKMLDLKAFTRDLVADMERDLKTKLDWVAAEHWNTDNPHIHLLVRGKADDGQNLIISRDYISYGMRALKSWSRWSLAARTNGNSAPSSNAKCWRRAGPGSTAPSPVRMTTPA